MAHGGEDVGELMSHRGHGDVRVLMSFKLIMDA